VLRSSSAWMVRFSIWVYRRLLGVYPASFRHTYAIGMTQVFRDCCRAASLQRGFRGILLLWPATLRDLLLSAGEERLWEFLRRWKGNAMLEKLSYLLVKWQVSRFVFLFLLPLLVMETTFLTTTLNAKIAGVMPDWNGNGLVQVLNRWLSDPHALLLGILFQIVLIGGPLLALAACIIPILRIDLRREAGSLVGAIRVETSNALSLATVLLSLLLLSILAGYLLLENMI